MNAQTDSKPATPPQRLRQGAWLWIVGFVLFFAAQFIVGAAWSGPGYSWSLNNVSDLGNVHCQMWGTEGGSTPRYVCSPLHSIMNIAFIVQGLCVVLGVVATRKLWKRGGASRTAQVFLILAGVGLLVAGLAPADVNENVHVVLGALLVAVFGNTGLILTYWGVDKPYQRSLGRTGLFLGVLGLVATYLFASQDYLGLGQGGMERLWGYNFLIWTFVAGWIILRRTPNDKHESKPAN